MRASHPGGFEVAPVRRRQDEKPSTHKTLDGYEALPVVGAGMKGQGVSLKADRAAPVRLAQSLGHHRDPAQVINASRKL